MVPFSSFSVIPVSWSPEMIWKDAPEMFCGLQNLTQLSIRMGGRADDDWAFHFWANCCFKGSLAKVFVAEVSSDYYLFFSRFSLPIDVMCITIRPVNNVLCFSVSSPEWHSAVWGHLLPSPSVPGGHSACLRKGCLLQGVPAWVEYP